MDKVLSLLVLIRTLLSEAGVQFKEIHHDPTSTSEESARARGEDISIGGKAIVMKVGDTFRLFVLSAARRVDSRKVKNLFGVKAVRFATKEELLQLTGLAPGSVPPFGRPILDLDLVVDRSIALNERIAFNAGSLTDSIVMQTADYLRIVRTEVVDFSQVPSQAGGTR